MVIRLLPDLEPGKDIAPISVPESLATYTLVDGAPLLSPKTLPKWASPSDVALPMRPQVAGLKFPRLRRIQGEDVQKTAEWTRDFVCACIISAAMGAAYSGLTNQLAWWTFFRSREPYANRDLYVGTPSMLGGAILALPVAAAILAYVWLEALYESVHQIYKPPPQFFAWRTSLHHQPAVPRPPRLARRYADYVQAVGIIAGGLLCGIVGPVVGSSIMVKHGRMDNPLTAEDLMARGATGSGIFVVILLVMLSVIVEANKM